MSMGEIAGLVGWPVTSRGTLGRLVVAATGNTCMLVAALGRVALSVVPVSASRNCQRSGVRYGYLGGGNSPIVATCSAVC